VRPEPPTAGEDPGGADGTEEPEHRPDGIELAREQARATAGSSPAARRRSPRRTTQQRRAVRGQLSGAHPDERDPQLLGPSLDRLVDAAGWALELRVRGVFARWPELVGADVAAHATPESFTEGRLVVRTDATAWATQLRLLTPTLLQRLNEELGAGTVVAIDVQGPAGPTWRRGRRSVRDGRGPRDTYG
jgi:predicted nucleic acid-binding Zn ribbon protein